MKTTSSLASTPKTWPLLKSNPAMTEWIFFQLWFSSKAVPMMIISSWCMLPSTVSIRVWPMIRFWAISTCTSPITRCVHSLTWSAMVFLVIGSRSLVLSNYIKGGLDSLGLLLFIFYLFFIVNLIIIKSWRYPLWENLLIPNM